jgi:hypothetical protein
VSEYGLAIGYELLWVICLAVLFGLLPIFLLSKPTFGAGTLPTGFGQSPVAGGVARRGKLAA